MKSYIYIDESKYMEEAISNYDKLERLTKNFTNLDKFIETIFNPADYYLDPKTTRIVIGGKSYIFEKNFLLLDRNCQFIILSPKM